MQTRRLLEQLQLEPRALAFVPRTAHRAPLHIAQAKKMPQAPEGAVRGGAIFPRHMHDQLQRKQQEEQQQKQQQQQ